MADKFGKKLRMMNEPDIKVLICGEIINWRESDVLG